MNSKISKIYLHAPGVLCALGDTLPDIREALFSGLAPGMRMSDAYSPGRKLCLGHVDAVLPDIRFLPREQRSRNNALLLAAFARIEADYRRLVAGLPPDRVAVVLGTSTSGIFESENAVRDWQQTGRWPDEFHYLQQELGSPAQMLAQVLGVKGAAYTVSTACTSGAKALISGARLLRAGLADLVLAGGVDTLTRFTVAGFSALGAVSPERCLPFSQNRAGINIGEAAALFMMSREKSAAPAAPIVLSGWGERSDGYHISAPDPSGAGAKLAINEALNRANVAAGAIAYVNLHGTATQQNDAMESRVMAEIFPGAPMSSTKPFTGHTLGAAGALEAALCWLTLTDTVGRLPPQLWDNAPDAALPPLNLVAPNTQIALPITRVLSTSFAFGGSNAALILERES
ncbi:MAG: beta-ketoacyl-ACP synthase [Azoarcus sp.]|jgi:3-oxoacyl-[acyl-carrier-protein] synthase-1|nr:beta-ketoacyl-ACP synthase [Azoarcus sp.]